MTFNVRNLKAFTQLQFIWLTQSNISTFISQVNIPTVLGNCAKKNMIGQRAAYPYLQFYCKVPTSTGSSDYNSSK